MQVQQLLLAANIGAEDLEQSLKPLREISPSWLLVFGGVDFFSNTSAVDTLTQAFPTAILMGCSTAGEISGSSVNDNSLIITAVKFESEQQIRGACTVIESMDDSLAAGERIGEQLKSSDLKAVMVLGPGLDVNGTELVEGIAKQIGDEIPITGGLAGDGAAFEKTWTLNNRYSSNRGVVAVGFDGNEINFAHGSFGGWTPFGPARKVTKCEGNILYELDGEPALSVYKHYLGDYADGLPGSGLLFPFEMLGEDHEAAGLIRTILGIDEEAGSLILAGSIDPDGYLKLMHANTDGLVDGAEKAADAAKLMFEGQGNSLAILISCVGRKLVMGELVEDEVEAVADVFGGNATLTGFYSYGEISPFAPGAACHLHNQTMTITYIGDGSSA